MSKGFNLPDDVSPCNQDAPWNKTAEPAADPDDYDWEEEVCETCGSIWSLCECSQDELADGDPRKESEG